MAGRKKGDICVGTSNIVVPGTKKTFPEAFQSCSRLTYYASLFNTLEINSSFYKVPMPATFQKWSGEVPGNFQFSVKLWRSITHAKALAYNSADIEFFMQAANQVAARNKGCLLIQFPKSITAAYTETVSALLQHVTNSNQHWRICMEFRHPSWYRPAVYAMLDQYNASLVLHDMPLSAVTSLHTRADFVYLRFHGIKGDYKGGYGKLILQRYAGKIKKWSAGGKNVYVYFNNTIGDAFNNAQRLAQLM